MTVPLPPPVILSAVQPDFEGIVTQLNTLLNQVQSWKDNALTADIGQTLLQIVGAVGATTQLATLRAAQETMSDTARLDSSKITIARMFSVHVLRKRSASTTLTLTNSDTTTFVSIPAYSAFTIDNDQYFNRVPIVFNVGVATQVVTLYEGIVTTTSFISDGTTFQKFDIGLPDYSTSDDDVFCVVNDTDTYVQITDGLWNYTSIDNVFYSNTLADGSVECIFGNGINGALPIVNYPLDFTYVVTKGASGNVTSTGRIVKSTTFQTIGGSTTVACLGGGDEKPADFYPNIGPSIFAANHRAVTRKDYRAQALQFPGVIDAYFRGQADIAPKDIRYMNIVYATLLSTTPFTTPQFNDFLTYMQGLGVYQVFMERADPTVIPITLAATVYCDQQANLTAIRSQIQTNIISFFALKAGSLGFSVYRSDILNLIMNTNSSINFVVLANPTNDVIISNLQFVRITTITLTLAYTTRNRINVTNGITSNGSGGGGVTLFNTYFQPTNTQDVFDVGSSITNLSAFVINGLDYTGAAIINPGNANQVFYDASAGGYVITNTDSVLVRWN